MEHLRKKYYQSIHTDICDITVFADENSVTEISLNSFLSSDNCNNITKKCCNELIDYLNGKIKSFSVPISFYSTDFNKKVWNALMTIPYGQTKTYGEIAKLIGSPNASRAVGNANNKNPLPIIIPCHRVVAKNGIGGYALPLEIKKKLLELEKNKEP